MKIELEAEPHEILEHGPELIQELASRLGVDLADLIPPEDILQKADEVQKEPQLKHQVLRDMHAKEQAIFNAQMKEMLAEISGLLTTPMKKGLDYTSALYEEDKKLYEAIRRKLKDTKDYKDKDFDDKRGILYGMSTNELVDLAGG